MPVKLTPEARYRIIPHPATGYVGGCAIIADEAAPLDESRLKAMQTWLDGDLYDVTHTGETTNDYQQGIDGDRYLNAPLYNVGGKLRALAPELAALLHRPIITTILGGGPNRTRIFGVTADGTVAVAMATLDPAYLKDETCP